MALHQAVVERLGRLAPDQRAAATSPPGPVLCIAPAGSGKTTTLVARIAWLVDSGADPGTIAAITFNKRAADELQERLAAALAPLGLASDSVRVRTFHALGLEILRSAGRAVQPLVDRAELLREVARTAGPVGWRRLDDAISRLKLDLGVTADEVAADPDAGPVARTFVAYEHAVAATGGLDFDDLVARSLRLLEQESPLLAAWRERCGHLLVDEVQDVDRSQLRLALLLAAPANRIFLVGDDDQSIYGWRLADVRRVLALADDLPGLQRIDLTTNYRCPRPVVERAVRLIEENQERFRKVVRARPGAVGRLAIAPDSSGGEGPLRRFLTAPLPEGQTRAVLARTNRELMLPLAIVLDAGLAVRSSATLLFEAPLMDELLAEAAATSPGASLLLRLAELRDLHAAPSAAPPSDDGPDLRELSEALLAWAAAFRDDGLETFVGRVMDARARLAALRRDDAPSPSRPHTRRRASSSMTSP